MSGGDGFANRSNVFARLSLGKNRNGGFVASSSPETVILDSEASSNEGPGIHFFRSDRSRLSGRSIANSADGLLIQSADVDVTSFEAEDNGGFGIRIADGGSKSPGASVKRYVSRSNRRGSQSWTD
ncbi:right-handed parallel beta-helix repeat-containing protein [Caballeronia calidae]